MIKQLLLRVLHSKTSQILEITYYNLLLLFFFENKKM